ncbi:MAG: hypothetical protein IJZ16_09080 [Clostridia bacterium]|nr:hypothetical protein [Clostridia bacterium]
MNGYSYSDIQNMQKKAMERVREMKRNSDEVIKSAQQEFNTEPKRTHKSNFSVNENPKVTNMPPNFPQNSIYPSFDEFFKKEQERTQENQKPLQRDKKPKQDAIQKLFDEPDKALILGLIMLLKSEGADEALIMALTYILS